MSDGQRRGDYALTTNLNKLYNKSEFTVKGVCGKVPVSLGLTDMKVDIPVASVRQSVKAAYEVIFHEEGGEIRDPKTGAKIDIIAMDGVFSLR